MKKLREQRQGEEDNVVAFPQPELATNPQPPSDDWLRNLPNGCRFVCHPKAVKGVFLTWYGIGDVQPKAILLGTDHEFNPGHLKFQWVDSMKFSSQHTFVQLLPDMVQVQEEGLPPKE